MAGDPFIDSQGEAEIDWVWRRTSDRFESFEEGRKRRGYEFESCLFFKFLKFFFNFFKCQIRRIQDEIDRTESKLETLSSSADTGKKRGKKEDAKKNEKEVFLIF